MTRKQMADRLDALELDQRISMNGKTYIIHNIKRHGGTLNRTDVAMLEEGKPAVDMVPGVALNAGKMVSRSNAVLCTWYARPSCMNWETA